VSQRAQLVHFVPSALLFSKNISDTRVNGLEYASVTDPVFVSEKLMPKLDGMNENF